ncbi:uncharacterized protein LOC143895046 [Temnothorax americanus]|uniref:uncharacterized protein LOC143895046 n=1 Tax=Temnothorax americanus TaxID=1964332 RepID=UPI004067D253
MPSSPFSHSPLPSFRVLYWNCREAVRRKPDIENLCQSYDIIFLSETLLKPHHLFSIFGFKVTRNDSDVGRQGIALLIRNNITFSFINLANILRGDDSVEAIGIKIFVCGTSAAIFGIYKHPGNCPQDTWQKIFNLANTFPHSLLFGDLNAHHPYWGAPAPNSAGKVIMDLLDRFPFTFLNPITPTFISPPGITPSLIDLAIASCGFAALLNVEILKDTCGSDHRPIEITVNANIKTNNIFSHKHKFSREQFKCFTQALETRADFIKSSVLNITDNEPIAQYDTFFDLLQKCISDFSPSSNNSAANNYSNLNELNKKHPPSPWWNADCEEAIKSRKKTFKIYRKNPFIANYQAYRKQVSETRRILRAAKRES